MIYLALALLAAEQPANGEGNELTAAEIAQTKMARYIHPNEFLAGRGEMPRIEYKPPLKIGDVELLDGRSFADLTVMSETGIFITVRHAKGMAKIEKATLPERLRELFPESADWARLERESIEAGKRVYSILVRKNEARELEQANIRAEVAFDAERRAQAKLELRDVESGITFHKVEYEIRGQPHVAHITFESASGTKQEHIKPNMGWKYSWTANADDFAYLSLQLERFPGPTTITLRIDGRVVKQAQVKQPHNIATVSGAVGRLAKLGNDLALP